jgi:hypothetical protein
MTRNVTRAIDKHKSITLTAEDEAAPGLEARGESDAEGGRKSAG